MPMSLHASLRAELLFADARMALERVCDVYADFSLAREIRVPDGTVSGTLLASTSGRVQALLVTSDKAVRVRVGQVTRNTDIALEPGGVYALLGIDTPAVGPCTVTYTPGDGSVATVAVLAAVLQEPGVVWTEPWEVLITFVPVLLWTESWEID